MKMIYLSLLVVGILLVILGVAVIALYPIRVEIRHRSVFIPIYNFKYKPPGNYTDYIDIDLLHKRVESFTIYNRPLIIDLDISKNSSIDNDSIKCKLINKSLTITLHGNTPNKNGTIFVTISKIENEESTLLANRSIKVYALSGKNYETVTPLINVKGCERLVNNYLLIEYYDAIPLNNVSGLVRISINSDLELHLSSLSIGVRGICEVNYSVDYPYLDIETDHKIILVPFDVEIDDTLFRLGLTISIIGVLAILLALILLIKDRVTAFSSARN